MKKALQIFILSCVFILKTQAQLGFCNGNSGDPIFTETFGTGTINTPLPAGTTTYSFANIDPQDGFYTVSSNTGFFDWHNTQDHTAGDSNGKSLIVNADFTIGEFYRTTINGLCENTSYEFSSWLLNLLPPSGCGSNGIPINVKFQIWDITDTNLLASGDTGDILGSFTPNWQQYGLVFQTLPSQTSVILKMLNNSIGGCGNDLAIDDLVFKTCGDYISVSDSSSNNNTSICSSQTPFTLNLIATPDFTVFSSHFYQWQESSDGVIWTDIVGEINQNISITGIFSTMYYRTKVAEFASNLTNADCITFSDVFQITVNQLPSSPSIDCWQTATINNVSCTWDVTGTQPPAPTGLECWESSSFNDSICAWEVTGTQPSAPTGLECWEVTSFNNTSCVWEVSGTQPVQPSLDCWETANFNNTTCSWEVSGTEPSAPSGLECWEVATFNTATCVWDVSGTQPVQPSVECWETTSFNITTCSWEVSGTEPSVPSGLECWEVATFNTATCVWDVSGTQPVQPSVECWEATNFNNTTCAWEVAGTQPSVPTGLECWEIATFNDITCNWEITGTQPAAPTGLECWQTTSFNNTTCVWDIYGEEPIESIEEFAVLCEGETIVLNANSSILNPTYLWNTGEMTEGIIVSNPGTYTVEISDNTCFTIIKTIYVTQYEGPQIASIFSDGNNIIIEMVNAGDFEYSLDGVQYQTSNSFFNVEGGLYTVYVKERNGCGIVSTNHLHFVIPKFFTPNNDGIHDTFNLKGIENYNASEVYIFNRFGKLLKSSKNQPFAWDGTFNNQELPTSDYWYIIKIDNQVYRGHFTLKH